MEILKKTINKKHEKMKIIHISYGVVTFCFLFIAMVLVACASSYSVQTQSDLEQLQVLQLKYQLAYLTGSTTNIETLQSQISTLNDNIIALEKAATPIMQAGYAFAFLTAFIALAWAAHAITMKYIFKKKFIDSMNNKSSEKVEDFSNTQKDDESKISDITDTTKSI